jgi:hypothetical protein
MAFVLRVPHVDDFDRAYERFSWDCEANNALLDSRRAGIPSQGSPRMEL